jgi:hypothetical protein
MMKSGLTYKIIGRRSLSPVKKSDTEFIEMEAVDVLWTSTDGPVIDKVTVPITFSYKTKEITYEEQEVPERRDAIKDQINVPAGTPDSIVMQILEEKKPRLAKALGIKL